jgi:hypothetical protein
MISKRSSFGSLRSTMRDLVMHLPRSAPSMRMVKRKDGGEMRCLAATWAEKRRLVSIET